MDDGGKEASDDEHVVSADAKTSQLATSRNDLLRPSCHYASNCLSIMLTRSKARDRIHATLFALTTLVSKTWSLLFVSAGSTMDQATNDRCQSGTNGRDESLGQIDTRDPNNNVINATQLPEQNVHTKEELFDSIAQLQGRRMDDQRATLKPS